jgi:hypothetical protein
MANKPISLGIVWNWAFGMDLDLQADMYFAKRECRNRSPDANLPEKAMLFGISEGRVPPTRGALRALKVQHVQWTFNCDDASREAARG